MRHITQIDRHTQTKIQRGTNKTFTKLLKDPHKHLRAAENTKARLRKQPKIGGSLKSTQRTGIKHSKWMIIPHK